MKLPTEILMEILQYLPILELNNLKLVNREFYWICKELINSKLKRIQIHEFYKNENYFSAAERIPRLYLSSICLVVELDGKTIFVKEVSNEYFFKKTKPIDLIKDESPHYFSRKILNNLRKGNYKDTRRYFIGFEKSHSRGYVNLDHCKNFIDAFNEFVEKLK